MGTIDGDVCLECGGRVAADWVFCQTCGSPLSASDQSLSITERPDARGGPGTRVGVVAAIVVGVLLAVGGGLFVARAILNQEPVDDPTAFANRDVADTIPGLVETTTTEAADSVTATTSAAGEVATTTTEVFEAPVWPDRIVFGFVPLSDAGQLQDRVTSLANRLSAALGIPVDGRSSTDYTALGAALGTGQVQIGVLAPANFVTSSRQYENLELLAQLVRFGDQTYHAQYFTNDPSVCGAAPVEGAYYYDDQGIVRYFSPDEFGRLPTIQVGWNPDGTREQGVAAGLVCPEPVDLSVIAGGLMSYLSEHSTTGYIFPVLEIGAAGLTENVDYRSKFSGHNNSVLDVYNGNADFGVGFDDARRTIQDRHPDVGERVIVFNITAPIANDVMVVDANLPNDLKEAIFSAIADFMSTPEGEEVIDDIYGWTDLTRADELTRRSLNLVEKAVDELGIGR